METHSSSSAEVLVSAPGSIMLCGEHAVLQGQPALVGAVRQRVKVRLQARSDDQIKLRSALGCAEMSLSRISMDKPFQFAGAAIKAALRERSACGFDLLIDAEMPADVGLASSAAVTVAVYAAVRTLISGCSPSEKTVWRDCRDVIRRVQGRGSGADAAAAVYGGIVLYSQDDGLLEHFVRNLPDVSLFYVGYKTPTPEVIARVEARRVKAPETYAAFDMRMGEATRAAARALRDADLPDFLPCLARCPFGHVRLWCL
jgi:mevalonate kinase